jgi:hypothetical protein
MVRRAAIGKSQRFEIFKRDHFTCQYCGAQPPNIVLVLDHIHPVCEGGDNSETNLIASCEACNQGKAGRTLARVPNRPDADLLYLEAQQEIAELRQFQRAKVERDKVLAQIVVALQDTWSKYMPESCDWVPAEHILMSMLSKYNPETVELGVITTARNIQAGRVKTYGSHWVRYMWGVMRTEVEENARGGEDAQP